jgi:hypothetical protein
MAKSKSQKSSSQGSSTTQTQKSSPIQQSSASAQSAGGQKTSAAQRREQQRQQQQRIANEGRNRERSRSSNNKGPRRTTPTVSPWAWVIAAVLVVAAVVTIFIYSSRQSSSTATTDRQPANPAVVNAITHVSPSVLKTVGVGSVQNPPTLLKNQPPLTGPGGKPEVFYFGAEYCPYCAAQRWAVIVALSRFGTFSNLSQTTSSAIDVYPNTPTFSFYGSKYTSRYIDFVPVETTTNQPNGNNGYLPLQTPTAAELQIVNKYDAPPYTTAQAGSIPFMDIGNKYLEVGPGYLPDVLTGQSWQQIATSLSNPSSPTAKGILGTANYLTAAICTATNQQPASVCQAAPIPAIEQALNKTALNSGSIQIGYVGDTPAAVARRRHLA